MKRIKRVTELLAEGYSGNRLVEKVSDTLLVSIATARADIVEARRLMRESFELDRSDLAVQLLSMHHEVFVAAMAARQYSAAVGVLASIGRLTGVEAPRA